MECTCIIRVKERQYFKNTNVKTVKEYKIYLNPSQISMIIRHYTDIFKKKSVNVAFRDIEISDKEITVYILKRKENNYDI